MSAFWHRTGPPSLDDPGPLHEQAEHGLPMHSIAHLYSSLGVDADLLYTSSIIGLALDGAPETVYEREKPRNWYAGCVATAGKVEVFPVESPGMVWDRARLKYDREEGTLMALATATACRVDLDVFPTLRKETFFDATSAARAKRVVG